MKKTISASEKRTASQFSDPSTIVRTKWYLLFNCFLIYNSRNSLESLILQGLQKHAPLVRSLKKAISERKLTHIIQGIQEVGVRSEAEIIFTWQNFGGGV